MISVQNCDIPSPIVLIRAVPRAVRWSWRNWSRGARSSSTTSIWRTTTKRYFLVRRPVAPKRKTPDFLFFHRMRPYFLPFFGDLNGGLSFFGFPFYGIIVIKQLNFLFTARLRRRPIIPSTLCVSIPVYVHLSRTGWDGCLYTIVFRLLKMSIRNYAENDSTTKLPDQLFSGTLYEKQ